MTHVVVVGGGITGLACALELVDAGVEVTVLEAGDRLGGNIRTSPFAGLDVDEAADAFLARVPEGIALCQRLGLGDQLVSPANAGAYVWARGALRRLPAGLALGVPGEIMPVARSGILSVGGMARAALEPVLPRRRAAEPDALGPMVAGRFGREVLERLVDPLIGGINAGDSARLSAEAVAPQIAGVSKRSRSLLLGLRAERRAHPPDPTAPVFFTLRGGMGGLIDALAAALAGAAVPATIEVGAPVESVEFGEFGERGTVLVNLGTLAPNRRRIAADAVVLACPAHASAGLLADVAPRVATTLSGIDYASVALVTFAFDDAAIGRPLDASGLLVPKAAQRLVTAASWASTKWAHWRRPGQAIVRASAGRDGDEHALDLTDEDLVGGMLADLERLMDVRGAPTQVRVSRWPRSFPQYRPGHLERIEEAERQLANDAPTVVLTGAAYRGLGIPACIRQGQAAARTLTARLRADTAARVKLVRMDRRTFLVAGAGALVVAACGGKSSVDDDPLAGAGEPATTAGLATTAAPPTTASTLPPSTAAATTAPVTTAPPSTTPVPTPVASPTNPHAPEPEVRIGSIAIPKLGLGAVLFEGVTLTTLNKGPGHWPGTALPSQSGNVVVAGHRVTHSRPFRNIDQLGPGDQVIFTIGSGQHTYTFANNEIVKPNAMYIVNQSADKTATLFACHPPGSARFRFVVHLTYVSSTTV